MDELREEVMRRLGILAEAGVIDLQALPVPKRKTRRIAPLPSCKATNHSHSLIEGGRLSWAQSLLRPSQELREGTDKSFLKWD